MTRQMKGGGLTGCIGLTDRGRQREGNREPTSKHYNSCSVDNYLTIDSLPYDNFIILLVPFYHRM